MFTRLWQIFLSPVMYSLHSSNSGNRCTFYRRVYRASSLGTGDNIVLCSSDFAKSSRLVMNRLKSSNSNSCCITLRGVHWEILLRCFSYHYVLMWLWEIFVSLVMEWLWSYSLNNRYIAFREESIGLSSSGADGIIITWSSPVMFRLLSILDRYICRGGVYSALPWDVSDVIILWSCDF